MTAALKTVLEKWAIPRMGVRKVHVTAFKGNVGSVRVFEKNGFVMKETVENCADISASKGGGKVGLHVLDWSLEHASHGIGVTCGVCDLSRSA